MEIGKQLITPKKNDRLRYFIQDLSEPFTLPKKCDVIVSMEVLEHILPSKTNIFLENIYGNLKNKGYVIISSPNPDKKNGEQFVWEEPHCYEWSFSEAKSLLKKSGFKIIKKCGILPRRNFYSHSKNKELYKQLKEFYPSTIVANILCPIGKINLCKQWMMLLRKRRNK